MADWDVVSEEPARGPSSPDPWAVADEWTVVDEEQPSALERGIFGPAPGAGSGLHPKTGKPILQNPDGSISTEESITVQVDDLNGGRPTNIPTIWDGQRLSEREAIGRALSSGQQYDSFSSVGEAVEAARLRSQQLGLGAPTSWGMDRDNASDPASASTQSPDLASPAQAGEHQGMLTRGIRAAAEWGADYLNTITAPNRFAREATKNPRGALQFGADVARSIGDIGTHLKGSAASAVEEDNPYQSDDWRDRWRDEQRELKDRRVQETKNRDRHYESFMGISPEEARTFGQNLGFSGVSAVAGVGAGLPAAALGGPAVGFLAGGAASGTAAYQMARTQFLTDAIEAADSEIMAQTGRGMTREEKAAKAEELDRYATEYGLWEAIPEAAGNVLGLKIIAAPLKSAFGKVFGKGLAERALTKFGAVYGIELGTEAVTQTGQHNVEIDAGLSDEKRRSFTNPSDIVESGKEVAGSTLLNTLIMGPGAAGAVKAYRALTSRPQESVVDDGWKVVEETLALPAPHLAVTPEGVAGRPEDIAADRERQARAREESGLTPDVERAAANHPGSTMPRPVLGWTADGRPITGPSTAPNDSAGISDPSMQSDAPAEPSPAGQPRPGAVEARTAQATPAEGEGVSADPTTPAARARMYEDLAAQATDPGVKNDLLRQAEIYRSESRGEPVKMTPRKRARRTRIVDPSKDDLVTAIRRLGGIDTDIESDWAGRLKHLNDANPEFGLPFIERPGQGRSLDELAELLMGYGYLQEKDAGRLAEMLWDAEDGTKIFSMAVESRQLEREMESRMEYLPDADEMADVTGRDEALSSYEEMAQDAPVEEIDGVQASGLLSMIEAEAEAVDSGAVEAILERAAIQGLSEAEIAAQLIEVIRRPNQDASEEHRGSPAEPSPRAQGPRGASAEIEPGIPPQTRSGSEITGTSETATPQESPLTLETQTEESLRERAEAERRREAEDAERRRQEEQRAQADRDRAGFTLTGSSRPADVAMSHGQRDLIGAAQQRRTGRMEAEFNGQRFPVESIEDAQRKWNQFRDESGGASSEIGHLPVFQDGKQIAKISYNGRAWDMDGNEITTPATGPRRFGAKQSTEQAKTEGADPRAPQDSAQKSPLDGLGFVTIKGAPNQRALTVRIDENTEELFNTREFGNPRQFRVTVSRRFPGKTITGASTDLGTFKTEKEAADAVSTRMNETGAFRKERAPAAAEPQQPAAGTGAVQAAAAQTDTNPTDAQKEAGNYRKGSVRLRGDDVQPASDERTDKINDLGEKIGGARKDTAQSLGGRTGKESKPRASWRDNYHVAEVVGGDGKGGWVLHHNNDRRGIVSKMPIVYPTKEAAEAAIPLAEVARRHRAGPVATAKGESQKYAIWRRISDRKHVIAVGQQFDSREDAMHYMAEHAEDIIDTKLSFGEEILPTPGTVYRSGVERRNGDVAGQDFIDTFGFRGVEFGNWNNQMERQEVMNHAYDALLDLAEVIRVPPQALSLNGDLALAFGARGQGLSGAKAHYETSYGAINLTKMKGAGSLAHEWLHAFDHYLARQDGSAPSEKVKNKRGDLVYDEGRGKPFASHGFLRDSKVREEVRAAYENLIRTMFDKAETYVEDSRKAEEFVGKARDVLAKKLDSIRQGLSQQLDTRYWKRNNKPASSEQLARFDELAEKLVNGESPALEVRRNVGSKSKIGSYRMSNDVLDEMGDIYKAVRGRSAFLSSGDGILDDMRGYIQNYRKRIDMLKDSAKETRKVRKIPTSFRMQAVAADQAKSGSYWSSPHEMAARAFAAYVEDKLQEKNFQNDFLAYHAHGAFAVPVYPEGFFRPYPEGNERKAVNAAFESLFDVIQTKETDRGVAMFSRRSRSTADRKESGDSDADGLQSQEDSALYSGYERNPGDIRGQRRDSGRVSEPSPDGGRTGGQGELFTNLPADKSAARAQAADTFHVRYKQVEVDRVRTGVNKVRTAEDAAHVFAPFRKHGQETMLALAVDKDGTPLSIIRHSKLAKDGASVDLLTLVGAIAATENATGYWLAHNHPSGNLKPSEADLRLTKAVVESLEGVGLEHHGHVIVATGGKATVIQKRDRSPQSVVEVKVRPLPRTGSVPITERVIRKSPPAVMPALTSPDATMALLKDLSIRNGLLLLDTRHHVVGVVALDADEMAALREGGRARRILAATDAVNSSASVIVSDNKASAVNLARFLNRFKGGGMRVLDAIIYTEGYSEPHSSASFGDRIEDSTGVFFSRAASGAPGAGKKAIAESIVNSITAQWKNAPKAHVLNDMSDAPESVRQANEKALSEGDVGDAEAFYYRSEVYIVLDGLEQRPGESFPEALFRVLAHEALGHAGLRGLFGADLTPILRQIAAFRRKDVAAKARKYGYAATIGDARDAVLREARESGKKIDPKALEAKARERLESDTLRAAEEVLAEMAESTPNVGFVRRAVEAIRQALRKLYMRLPASVKKALGQSGFLKWVSGMSDAEIIQNYIVPARRFVQEGRSGEGAGAASPAFSRAPAVDSDAFRRWFGDSKVVDANGRPLVVYHGTIADFGSFDNSKTGRNDNGLWGKGHYFTANPENASSYALRQGDGAQVVPAYVSIKRPLILKTGSDLVTRLPDGTDSMNLVGPMLDGAKIKEIALSGGHDGVIQLRPNGMIGDVVAFRPEQIKSATGNQGTFDGSNPDIRFSRSGRRDMTSTPEFKRWFGDSKVVDDDGKPLVVYHGTRHSFDEFKRDGRKGRNRLHYFTDDPAVASEYAGSVQYGSPNVMPAYVSLQKPFMFDAGGEQWGSLPLDLFPEDVAQHFDERNILRGRTGQVPRIGFTDVIRGAVAAGYDGVIAEQIRDGGGPYGEQNPSRVVVASSSEQIKSAVGNSGDFDPANPDIRFSRSTSGLTPAEIRARERREARTAQPESEDRGSDAPPAGNRTEDPPAFGPDGFDVPEGSRLWQELVFKAQDRFYYLGKVQKAAEKARGRTLSEAEDAYLAELRYHGQAGAAIEDFQRDHIDPLLKVMSDNGLSVDEVDRYLHARHAPEANAQLARINPERENNESLSGMTNDEAAAVMREAEETGKAEAMQDIARRVDVITKARRDMLAESGIESPETISAWESAYQNYVPLHREGFGDALPRKGKGYDTRGKEKRRAGSERGVVHVLANVVAQYEATAIRAEKVKVGRAMLEFARKNPNPSLYEVDKVEYVPQFDADGLVTYRPAAGMQVANNVLVVRENGVDHRITFNERNRDAMRVAHAMKNLGADDAGTLLRALHGFTRFLAMMNTSMNPEFVISNFFRDLQTAGFNLQDTEIRQMTRQIIRDVGKAWRGIRAFQKQKNHPWAAHFDEFRKAGAQTGWIDHYRDVTAREKALRKKVEHMKKGTWFSVRRGITGIVEFIDAENTAVENAIRLSAYVHARRMGMSEAQAARIAKEMTVNFNKRGDAGMMMNALYMFYNASVQGSVRIIKALRHKRVRQLVYGTVVGAAMLDMLNRAMGGDDEEGKPRYDSIPDHIKERNLIIMFPDGSGEYLKIPLPWGYNVFHVAGQEIGSGFTRPGWKPGESALRITGAVGEAFNPLSSATLLQFLSPTVTDPIVQWSENKNWHGGPIRPQDNPYGPDEPDSQKYFSNVREPSRWITEQLNSLTGGDEVRPGAVDISPAALDLAIDTLTGGAGRFVADTFGTPIKALKGDEVESRDIPMLRKLYGKPGASDVQRNFYEAMDEIRTLDYWMREYQKRGEKDKAAKIKSEHPEQMKMLGRFKATDGAMRKLRAQQRQCEKRGNEECVARTKEKQKEIMKRFNQKYYEATQVTP